MAHPPFISSAFPLLFWWLLILNTSSKPASSRMQITSSFGSWTFHILLFVFAPPTRILTLICLLPRVHRSDMPSASRNAPSNVVTRSSSGGLDPFDEDLWQFLFHPIDCLSSSRLVLSRPEAHESARQLAGGLLICGAATKSTSIAVPSVGFRCMFSASATYLPYPQ